MHTWQIVLTKEDFPSEMFIPEERGLHLEENAEMSGCNSLFRVALCADQSTAIALREASVHSAPVTTDRGEKPYGL